MTPPMLLEFGCYADSQVIRHVYHAPLTVELNQLVLAEGWDMGLLTPDQIWQGSSYSTRASGATSGTSSPANFAGFIRQGV